MTSKKNQVKKPKVKEKLKKTVLATSKVLNEEEVKDKSARKKNLKNEMSMKVKNHWGVIQKDFRMLAEDMICGIREVREILSEKGMESMRDIQTRMNSKFIWK